MEELGGVEINGVADNGAQFLDLGQRGLKGKTEFFYRRGVTVPLCTPRETSPTIPVEMEPVQRTHQRPG